MEKRIEKILIEPQSNGNRHEEAVKLKVAAYCRVSTDMEEQRSSFESQVKTYRKLVESRPDWVLVRVYADEGITGTSAEKRPEFMKMIKDCEDGKIDLIITKSISRFARNTLECLTYVRLLRYIGVHLIFENNNIDTRTAFSEMILTVLAAFAQEESRSISENTKWGIRKRFEEGVTRWCRLYGYEKTEDGGYRVVPEQAAVVQKIFYLYEHGSSFTEIREFLKKHGIPSPNGAKTWSQSVVQNVLTNERYAGDLLLQKFCTEDHISHKAIKNDCTEVPSYYIENHHTPIVSRKQFERVSKIRAMRRMQDSRADAEMGKCVQYPLAEKLRCPYCGSILYQRSIPIQAKRTSGWFCERGENACHSFIIRSPLVESALLKAYHELDEAVIMEKLKNPAVVKEAEQMLKIRKAYPTFERVDYWWVDDLIDHITFGLHRMKPREYARMKAAGVDVTDDQVMKVFWRCGIVSTVKSGVKTNRDHPVLLAGQYKEFLERREANKEEEEA